MAPAKKRVPKSKASKKKGQKQTKKALLNITNKKDIDWFGEKFDFECPVCYKTITTSPIYQCTNGHLICSGCEAQVRAINNVCPKCRVSLATKSRNILAEKIARTSPALPFCRRRLQRWGWRGSQEKVRLPFKANVPLSLQ